MQFLPTERVALFIDGANLYAASRNLGFDVDYRNLLQFFRGKSHVIRAYYYAALLDTEEYSPLKPLTDWLAYNGYTLITKTAREFTDAAAQESRDLDVRTMNAMRQRFSRNALTPEDQLSYDLFINGIERSGAIYPYRKNAYVFDQMNGAQSDGPAFLINIHKVDTVADAEAYVSRLRGMGPALDQAIAECQGRLAAGMRTEAYAALLPIARNTAMADVLGEVVASQGPSGGEAKVAKYGKHFLAVVHEHQGKKAA